MRLRVNALGFVTLLTAGCSLGPLGISNENPHRSTYQGPTPVVIASSGTKVTLDLNRFRMTITDAHDKVLLDSLDAAPISAADPAHAYGPFGATHHETTVRPEIPEGWDHVDGVDDAWHHGSLVARADVTTTSASIDLFDPADEATTLHLDIDVEGGTVTVKGAIVEDGSKGTGPLNQVGQAFRLGADEHFFGLGERMATVDHRGKRYQCWVEEGGIGAGEKAPPSPTNPSPNGPGMTHVPVPFFLSTLGYGLYLEGTYRSAFSFGAEDDSAWMLQNENKDFTYHVFVHEDPKDTIADYTRMTGRARVPAPWVFGPRRRVDHGTIVNGVPEELALRNAKVPTTMVDDTTHFLPNGSQVGREAFLADWTKAMHALGYKAIGYFNPYVSTTQAHTAPLIDYGRKHGYFLKLDDGTEFDTFVISGGPQNVATIDLTNPDARAWYGTLLQQALDLGYDGWMLDFGEYIPQYAVFYDGSKGWEGHNAFPLVYDETVFDYLTEQRGDDFMFYSRAGYAGIQSRTPIIWSGDPASSYDNFKGLPAQVRAGINAGLSGIPFWGSDISGYACLYDPPADKTLYLRWAQMGALSSDMHDENACGQKPADQPDKWTLWSDAETTKIYGDYARLHTRLNPYILMTAKEAARNGLPVMRHPWLMHPAEPQAIGVELEYYFGPYLYVAPIVRRDAKTREFWLPPGQWFDWFTLEPKTGGATITRDVPLAEMPLYLRAGGIVAMLDSSVETLAPDNNDQVTSALEMKGVLDARAAVAKGAMTGHVVLADGGVLDVAWNGAPMLPAGFTMAPDEATLAACSGCGRIDPIAGTGAVRVRLTGAVAAEESITAGGLVLRQHSLDARRVRWDVLVGP